MNEIAWGLASYLQVSQHTLVMWRQKDLLFNKQFHKLLILSIELEGTLQIQPISLNYVWDAGPTHNVNDTAKYNEVFVN